MPNSALAVDEDQNILTFYYFFDVQSGVFHMECSHQNIKSIERACTFYFSVFFSRS